MNNVLACGDLKISPDDDVYSCETCECKMSENEVYSGDDNECLCHDHFVEKYYRKFG